MASPDFPPSGVCQVYAHIVFQNHHLPSLILLCAYSIRSTKSAYTTSLNSSNLPPSPRNPSRETLSTYSSRTLPFDLPIGTHLEKRTSHKSTRTSSRSRSAFVPRRPVEQKKYNRKKYPRTGVHLHVPLTYRANKARQSCGFSVHYSSAHNPKHYSQGRTTVVLSTPDFRRIRLSSRIVLTIMILSALPAAGSDDARRLQDNKVSDRAPLVNTAAADALSHRTPC